MTQDIAIEGRFELPPLASLTAEDQIFVAAFVRCHGSIKQMEKFFGVSYPTIKNRLNRIGALLPFAEIDTRRSGAGRAGPTSELLSRLERGEMNVNDVLSRLRKAEDDHEPTTPAACSICWRRERSLSTKPIGC